MNVTTTPVNLGGGDVLVQNLGAGILYVGTSSSVSSSDGIQVDVGKSIVVGSVPNLYAVSASTSDVRIINNGQGVFDVAPAA